MRTQRAPQQIIKKETQPEDHRLQSYHMHQVIVLIVLDQQSTDTTLAHAQPLHHRDHHPRNGEILPHDLEHLVGK